MPGQTRKRAVHSLLGILAALAGTSALAADKPGEEINLTVSQMQAGGFVYDKGSRLVTDPRLKISFTPLFETFRSQAPLNVKVRLQWTGNGLLEGRLLCDIYANQRYVGSWKSHEIAVNQDVLEFPLILPPSPLYNDRDPFHLRIAFEAEDRTIVMDSRDLAVESGWSRNYVVGVVAPDGVTRITGFQGETQQPQVADLFQLANFHEEQALASQLVTNTAPILARDLPLDPMRFTALDLVVISPESLRELRPAQWNALATWIRAGGRACVIATMAVPENLRPAWRELFNERPDAPLMTFSDQGVPEFSDGGKKLRLRAGCGRVLCLTEPANVDSPKWLDDVLWLFGVRETPRKSILAQGKWTIGKPGDELPAAFHPLAPARRPITAMRQPLSSPEVGRVSPVTILFLLGTCLMLIGPVDYFVLGRLGLRKLTWLFLPCVAVATTWATMRVSQSALGAKDSARSVSVADLDSVGRVCRVSRIEQRRAGRETVNRQEMSSSLRIDFERSLVGWNSLANPLVPREGDAQSNQPPVRYSGKITGTYEVLEPMFQWSPRLFRESLFGNDPRINSKPLQSINWTELNDTTWETAAGREKILKLVRDVLPEARVFVRFLGKTHDCDTASPPGDGSTRPESAAVPGVEQNQIESGTALLHLVAGATSSPRTYGTGGGAWYQPSVTRPLGLFGLVRERSPTCGADLEDFQWIDDQDRTEAVLFIMLEGEDTVIFRQRMAR